MASKNYWPTFSLHQHPCSNQPTDNRLLIAPLTGTDNQCQLLVRRFIRAKMLAKMNIQDDCFTSSIKGFQENKTFDEKNSFLESQETKRFLDKNPSSQFCKPFPGIVGLGTRFSC